MFINAKTLYLSGACVDDVKAALSVIRKCSTRHGLYASAGTDGYNSVWARDSIISLLGASLFGKDTKQVYRNTLNTLAKHQSRLGQIPNCVDLFDSRRKKQVTFATIDSTLWFLIGEYAYTQLFDDYSVIKSHEQNIAKAFVWLAYQDAGEDGMPEQQPTCDWQDCFPHKYGHTLNTQALYYEALMLYGMKSQAAKLKRTINGFMRKDLSFFDKKLGYYLPWIWKDHDGTREQGRWFDSLANILAILSGIAEKGRAERILAFIEHNGINKPYPVRCIYPAIRKGDREWQPYFAKCLAGKPWNYLNGGIWPFIGGFYVSSLVAAGRIDKARRELACLMKANMLGSRRWEFNEWINPISGKAEGGAYQAWSAGAYLFAKASVEGRELPVLNAAPG